MVAAIRAVDSVDVDIDDDGYLIITQADSTGGGDNQSICIPQETVKQLFDAIALCMRERGGR
jgi:hypothetical protein